jgi:ribosomal protein S18 acetylase RimI-like enzyme
MNEPRPYKNLQDLDAMCEVLKVGRNANNGSYYIHPGDLKWWLYYPPLERDYWDHIYLWDDPEQPGRLLAWALISPGWVGFDVYTQPGLRGSSLAKDMYIWAEERASGVARQAGKATMHVLWVFHDDDFLDSFLIQRGFRRRKGLVHMRRSLDMPISPVEAKGKFVFRNCKGEEEASARAKVQYGAFGSAVSFERYLRRFTSFMRSPVYDPRLDVVAVAPDGRFAAFCFVWLDPTNLVGLFEPVGTHPDFQRMGLGSAIIQEGLRRMQETGMKSAIVSTPEDNLAAIKLYEFLGFQLINQLGTYEKDVTYGYTCIQSRKMGPAGGTGQSLDHPQQPRDHCCCPQGRVVRAAHRAKIRATQLVS